MSEEMREKKTILVFVSWYLPGHKSGGPVKTIANLVDATHADYNYLIVARDRDLGDSQTYVEIDTNGWNDVGQAQVRYIEPGWRGLAQIIKVVRSTSFDALYLNSFFSIPFSLLPQWANRRVGKPVILVPRGQFSRGALALKSFKKRIFILLYRFLGAHKKVVWQASTEHEHKDITDEFGKDVDIVIAENIASRQYAKDLPAKRDNQLRIVFLSRISPKKNLEFALCTLKAVDFPIVYDIYGPAEDEQYWSRCQALIAQMPDNIEVNFMGTLASQDVVETLAQYDGFFFPTKGENYGHVIAEALCAGLPLVIADTTPWRDLADHGVGWDLPLGDPAAFADPLWALYHMDTQTHSTMRKRVLGWAKDRFEKPDAANANRRMFEYVLTLRGNHFGEEKTTD